MEKNLIPTIIGLAIGLILIGILLPIGLNSLTAYDGTYEVGTLTSTNTDIATLVATVLPIVIVIAIVLAMVSSSKLKGGSE